MQQTKVLRDGSVIRFTRKNPTVTLNAIRRHFEKHGFEIGDDYRARTGSCYLSAWNGDFEVDLRSANHTQGFTTTKEASIGISRHGGISVEIDLSEGEMNAADVKALVDEAWQLHKAGLGKRIKENGVASVMKGEVSERMFGLLNECTIY